MNLLQIITIILLVLNLAVSISINHYIKTVDIIVLEGDTMSKMSAVMHGLLKEKKERQKDNNEK